MLTWTCKENAVSLTCSFRHVKIPAFSLHVKTTLDPLPLSNAQALETPAVLKLAVVAHRRLAELKGAAGTIPNESILIETLGLQEAKDSSEVENIVTTNDDLFRADATASQFTSVAA